MRAISHAIWANPGAGVQTYEEDDVMSLGKREILEIGAFGVVVCIRAFGQCMCLCTNISRARGGEIEQMRETGVGRLFCNGVR